jgi:hypothetical protein
MWHGTSHLQVLGTFLNLLSILEDSGLRYWNDDVRGLSNSNGFIRGKMEAQEVGNRAGGVARVIERLLSKHEALSSNPSTDEKRKRKRSWQPLSTLNKPIRAADCSSHLCLASQEVVE